MGICFIANSNNQILMKSTLKVHSPSIIILLICINDVQGKEPSFLSVKYYEGYRLKVVAYLIAVQRHSDSQI